MGHLETFHQYRSLLFSIAYRMLGSVTDAEDMVQETWIRWQETNTAVRFPKAFLSSIITRLCIDQLRSARMQREQYVGTWLPEPIVTQANGDSQNNAELAESLSFGFLALLDCLSPTERAIFLLREVFDYEYPEIARFVNKSVANCRQIVSRSRQKFLRYRPCICSSYQQKEEAVEKFLTSWMQGDLHTLIELMAEDITFWSDGGGQVIAAQRPLHGCQKVARFLVAIRQSRLIPELSSQLIQINYQPSILNSVMENPQSTFSFDFSDRNIQAIFAVVNPEKLKKVNMKTFMEI